MHHLLANKKCDKQYVILTSNSQLQHQEQNNEMYSYHVI